MKQETVEIGGFLTEKIKKKFKEIRTMDETKDTVNTVRFISRGGHTLSTTSDTEMIKEFITALRSQAIIDYERYKMELANLSDNNVLDYIKKYAPELTKENESV